MMSEDITRKKLTTGMSWVQRFSAQDRRHYCRR